MNQSNKILPENTIPQATHSKWKIWVLAIASLLFQSLTWIGLRRALDVNPSAEAWIWATITASVAISITTFFLLVSKSRLLANLIIILSAAVYYLASPKDVYVWLGGVIFALLAFWYEMRIRRESKSRVDFSIGPVVGSSVVILIYAILLLLGFNIYYHVSADFQANPDKFYNRLGQQATKTIPYFTRVLLPDNVDPNQSLEDYLFQRVAKENPEFHQATPTQRQIFINQAKQAFQDQFQITASNAQSLEGIMAQVVVSRLRQAVEPFHNYLPLLFAILVTGLLATFAFLIRWLILFISWILFKILLWAGFFKLEKVQVEVEKLGI